MYRLGELSDQQRNRIGGLLLVLGTLGLAAGVVLVHYAALPEERLVDGVMQPVDAGFFQWIPRGHWWKFGGYVVAFGGSQLMLLGATLVWVLNQKMTWARAAFTAFLVWIELVLIFGVVPSEWLNFSQTDLDMAPQKVALTIPPWLLLGNEVQVSQAALKDAISGVYHIVMLGAAIVFAYKVQDVGKRRPAAAAPEAKWSPYGRPLVKGD
jgi:hypothetical protein